MSFHSFFDLFMNGHPEHNEGFPCYDLSLRHREIFRFALDDV